jgi:hypothetical protein
MALRVGMGVVAREKVLLLQQGIELLSASP